MQFLEQMNIVVPWKELVSMIEKHIPEVREEIGWRPRIEIIKKLKMYFLSSWFNLSDIQTEEGIYDRASFQRFMDIDVTTDQIPDSSTLCNFRIFLHTNKLWDKILSIVNEYMQQSWITLTEGRIIDATIIKAPSSTKNEEKKRDPEMSSTKKNNNFYFWAKIHIATDEKGIITELRTTTAKVHDSQVYDDLISDSDTRSLGDSAYEWQAIQDIANAKWICHVAIIKRKRWQKELPIHARLRNTLLSMPRKVVEFPFGVIKDIRWHRQTKYRWLAKLHTQRCVLASLCNLYRMRWTLMNVSFSL